MKLTCIMCPMGCEIEVTKTKTGYTVTGNNCKRGETYAIQEMTEPKRIVTAILKTKNDGVLSVKTSAPVPKNLVMSVMDEINKLKVKSAKLGDVVLKNVLNTGADIVVTSYKVE